LQIRANSNKNSYKRRQNDVKVFQMGIFVRPELVGKDTDEYFEVIGAFAEVL
jgi:hypothetical protein